MSNALPDITKLTLDEKLELMNRLTASIQTHELAISDELMEELDRRHEEFLRDPSIAVSWDEVKAQLLNRHD